MTPTPDITCAGCAVTRERPVTRTGSRRMPGGWKCLRDRFWCSACKRQRFALRAITLPVSGPVDGSWTELRAALHTAFSETTRCANWLATQFYARDARREPGDLRLRTMPRVYLYPEARRLFPALASQTLASLEQQVLARYRAVRLTVVWRHAASLSTYRYPTPLPLPARMWTLDRIAQRWCLTARIGDRRWRLRLRHGPDMQRQLRVLAEIAAGAVEAGEAVLYEIPSHRGDHRSESAPDRRLMLKIVVWLPRRERSASLADEGMATRTTAFACRSDEAFLTVRLSRESADGRRDTWSLRGEQVRRWLADATPRNRSGGLAAVPPIVERRRASRLRRRLDDWSHRAAAHLVAWAERRGVTTIIWDDANPGCVPAYPWPRFVRRLTDKAQLVGIDVALAPVPCDGEPLTDGHPQAEAGARPGTLAGRDRSRERAKAPEIAGRSSRRLRGDRRPRPDVPPIAGAPSSGPTTRAAVPGARVSRMSEGDEVTR